MRNRALPNLGLNSLIFFLLSITSTVFASNHEASTTQGSFSVNDGAASFSIPIVIPPGIAGMEPSISLSYSSQAGNGLVGKGWNIGGLSQISRCPTTIAQDGSVDGVDYDDNDMFCLDGQRLINVGGNVYKTEKESFLKITSVGGIDNDPDYFIVKNKSGQTKHYGNSKDSRVEAQGRTKATIWAINKVEDVASNYLTYTYYEDNLNGFMRIDSIDYSGNTASSLSPSTKVVFETEARPDVITNFQAGSKVYVPERLINIKTYAGDSLVKVYKLFYEQGSATGVSRMNSVQECSGSSTCKKAVNFTWSDDGIRNSFEWDGNIVNHLPGSWTDYNKQYITMDVDGNGVQELVYIWNNGGVWIDVYGFNKTAKRFEWSGNTKTKLPGNWSDSRKQFLTMDIDGDGIQELIYIWNNGGVWIDIYKYNKSTKQFVWSANSQSNLPGAWAEEGRQFIPMDVDGDGVAELAYIWKNGGIWIDVYKFNVGTNKLEWFGNTQSQLPGSLSDIRKQLIPMDVDGDGVSELAYVWNNGGNWIDLYKFNVANKRFEWFGNTQSQLPGSYLDDKKQLIPMDVDGDGTTELVYIWNNGGTWIDVYRFNPTSAQLQWVGNTKQKLPGAWTESGKGFTVMDVNKDGVGELVYYWNNGGIWIDSFSFDTQASQFEWSGNITGNPPGSLNDLNKRIIPMDYDGDGYQELAYIWNNGGGWIDTYSMYKDASSAPVDSITSIASGFGSVININYLPMTNSDLYTKDENADNSIGIVDVQAPSYFVSSYTQTDGIGGIHSFSYKYEGMKASRLGRGGLGFRKITMTSDSTGLTSTRTMHQDFPRDGMLESEETKLANGQRFTYTSNTWESINNNGIYTIQLKETYSESKDLNGTLGKKQKITTTYDNNNNAIYIVSDSLDGYKTVTDNTYLPQGADNWDKLTYSTVTQHHPSRGPEPPRTSSFEYDYKGMLRKETIEPGNPNYELSTTYTYDVYGNKETLTVEGNPTAAYPVPTRTTTSRYVPGTIGTNAPKIETINTLGHKEIKTYDARFGVVTSLVGPNGLETKWTYDNFGMKTREDRADGTWTTIDYHLCELPCSYGAKIKITSQTKGSAPSTIYYDQLGREIMRESLSLTGRTKLRSSQYNAEGQVWKQSLDYFAGDPVYYKTVKYDLLGRAYETQSPNGRVDKVIYDGKKVTEIVDANNKSHIKISYKNSQGKLTNVIDAFNSSEQSQTFYRYDGYGNLLEVEDNVGNIVKMYYDLRGQKVAMDDPDMGNWQYKYDPQGKLRWQKDAKGNVVTINYDALGRMKKRTENEGVSQWVYDNYTEFEKGIGKLHKSFNDKGYLAVLHYDNLGRPIKNETTLDSTLQAYVSTVSYDSNGRVAQSQYPTPVGTVGLNIKNIYNGYGYLNEVRNAANDAMLWRADFDNALGAINTETLGNGVITMKTYNPLTGMLEGISTGAGNLTNVQLHAYQYDSIGNLTQRSDINNNNIEDFTFDELNRLKTTSIQGLAGKTFDYDSIGNIKHKSDVGDYLYGENGAGPHAVTTAGGKAYLYDANGNMQSGNGKALSYTSFNKPLSVSANGNSNYYTYGPDHNRIKKDVNKSGTTNDKTIYYFGKSLEVIKGRYNTEHRHNISVGSTIVQYSTFSNKVPEWLYLHTDRLGSVDAITKADGTLESCTSFSAYGARRSCAASYAELDPSSYLSKTTMGFTGHEMDDEIGLINMNARMYDPILGRFLQADTIIQFADYSQGYNRYMYINNNPLSGTDPSGHSAIGDVIETVSRITEIGIYDAHLPIVGSLYNRHTKAFFLKHAWARQAATIAASYFGGSLGAAAAAAYFTHISGGDLSDVARAAVVSYVTAYATSAINSSATITGAQAVILHGMVGGFASVANGGKFEDGFKHAALIAIQSIVLESMNNWETTDYNKIEHADSYLYDDDSGTTSWGQVFAKNAAEGVIGGSFNKLRGGEFDDGFRKSFVLSVAYEVYHSVIPATWGTPVVSRKNGMKNGKKNLNGGPNVAVYRKHANGGNAIAGKIDSIGDEGSSLMNSLGRGLPAFESTARIHDMWVGPDSSGAYNVGTMIPAYIISAGAVYRSYQHYTSRDSCGGSQFC